MFGLQSNYEAIKIIDITINLEKTFTTKIHKLENVMEKFIIHRSKGMSWIFSIFYDIQTNLNKLKDDKNVVNIWNTYSTQHSTWRN